MAEPRLESTRLRRSAARRGLASPAVGPRPSAKPESQGAAHLYEIRDETGRLLGRANLDRPGFERPLNRGLATMDLVAAEQGAGSAPLIRQSSARGLRRRQ